MDAAGLAGSPEWCRGSATVASGTGPRGRPPGRPASGQGAGALARLGLTGPWAEDAGRARLVAGDRPAPGAETIMWALARSPDPDLALRTVERLPARGAPTGPELDAALRTRHRAARPAARAARQLDRARRPPGHPPRPLAPAGRRPGRPPDDAAGRDAHRGRRRPGRPAGRRRGGARRRSPAPRRSRAAHRLPGRAAGAGGRRPAAVGEPELPVLDVEDVAAQLADLAAAALQAALAVAVAETERRTRPAGRDRDGQVRRRAS